MTFQEKLAAIAEINRLITTLTPYAPKGWEYELSIMEKCVSNFKDSVIREFRSQD